MPIYTLYDTASGRRIGKYTNVEDALDVVRRDIARDKADLWRDGALVQLTPDDEPEDILLFEEKALIERARRVRGSNPPVASAIVRRRTSTISDARRMAIDASSVLGSLSAASEASRILDSFSGVTEMARIANEAFLRLGSIPPITLPIVDVSSTYRAYLGAQAMSALAMPNWDAFFLAPSAGLRAAAEALASSAMVDAGRIAAGMIEQNRAHLTDIAIQIAEHASAATQIGAYVVYIERKSNTTFIYERTEDEDYIAAVAPEHEDTEGEDHVTGIRILWRRQDDRVVALYG